MSTKGTFFTVLQVFFHFWDCSDLSHCIKFLRYLLLTRACIFHELLQHSILILRIQQFWFVEASAFLWREPIMWGRFFSWPNLQMHQKQLKKNSSNHLCFEIAVWKFKNFSATQIHISLAQCGNFSIFCHVEFAWNHFWRI